MHVEIGLAEGNAAVSRPGLRYRHSGGQVIAGWSLERCRIGCIRLVVLGVFICEGSTLVHVLEH